LITDSDDGKQGVDLYDNERPRDDDRVTFETETDSTAELQKLMRKQYAHEVQITHQPYRNVISM